MNIRLIAGQLGGRIIAAPPGRTTHPMSERVRGSLFNIISSKLEGADVLDAFAGTGSLGFEALSRGAVHATFIEKDRVANKILHENAKTLNVAAATKIIQAPVYSWAKSEQQTYDIIFADPPYHDIQLSTVILLFGLLKPNGLMVLSYPGRGEVPTANGVVVVDNRSYGNAALAFYRRSAT